MLTNLTNVTNTTNVTNVTNVTNITNPTNVTNTTNETNVTTITDMTNIEIQKIIPHRYPFLLVDRILEVTPGERAVGIKNVTINEPFFQGHFPGNPIMPGVLIVEAMAQVAGVAGLLAPENKGKLGLFAGIEKMKFKKQVTPGDILVMEAVFLAMKMGVWRVKVSAKVDNKIAAEGEIRVVIVDNRQTDSSV